MDLTNAFCFVQMYVLSLIVCEEDRDCAVGESADHDELFRPSPISSYGGISDCVHESPHHPDEGKYI